MAPPYPTSMAGGETSLLKDLMAYLDKRLEQERARVG